MRSNRLRELLNADKPTLGTHLQIPYPGIIEVAGLSGAFDYVEIVLEYMTHDLHLLEHIGRTVELAGLCAMAKVEQEGRIHLSTWTIGAGIQNMMFSDVRTVEDVRECVRAVRPETPEDGGVHGVGVRRSVGYFREPGSPAFVQSLRDSVVAIMIEKKQAVENLEELLSVPGVDIVQFGPADYSMSAGIAGQWDHPTIKAAERRVIETALKMGIAPRAEINDPKDAQRYLDMGVRHFCVGRDIRILADFYEQTGEAMREVLARCA